MKMGGMESLMGMMPGMGKMQKQAAEAGLDDTHDPPPDRADQLDDEEGAGAARDPAGQPQEAHRGRVPGSRSAS